MKLLSIEERDELQEIEAGGKVAVRHLVYGQWRWTVGTIDRLTAKHLVVGPEMFSKRTGRVRGYSTTHTRIAPLNAEYRQRVETDTAKVKEEYVRQECITTLTEDILWTLPTRLLEELAEQVKQCLQGQGRRVPETVDQWNALRAERI